MKPILAIFNDEAETFLEVDASKVALRTVLCQTDQISKIKHPIGYFPQKLKQNFQHLCSFDLELLATTEPCKYFRPILSVAPLRYSLTINPYYTKIASKYPLPVLLALYPNSANSHLSLNILKVKIMWYLTTLISP